MQALIEKQVGGEYSVHWQWNPRRRELRQRRSNLILALLQRLTKS
jgi:hypothetical protein